MVFALLRSPKRRDARDLPRDRRHSAFFARLGAFAPNSLNLTLISHLPYRYP